MTDATEHSVAARVLADAAAAAEREKAENPGITKLGEAHIMEMFLRDHGFWIVRAHHG
jgi:hypothetical protein